MKQVFLLREFRLFSILICSSGRPDRQPEFTQIDLELSFVSRENIFQLIEELIVHCWPDVLPMKTFPRMTYAQAMLTYGTDKSDTRFALHIEQTNDAKGKISFKISRSSRKRLSSDFTKFPLDHRFPFVYADE